MSCAEIQLRATVEASRLDAEFWQEEFVAADAVVRQVPGVKTLSSISKRMRKGIFSILAEEYVDDGVPLLRVSNVRNGLIDMNKVVRITEARHALEGKTAFGSGDIVINKTGTIGAAVLTLDSANVSQDLIGLEIADHADHNPYYIAAFLNSRYGLLQQQRWLQGQVQMHLALEDARKFLVPFPAKDVQADVERLFREGVRRLDAAGRAYDKAEELILQDAGWKSPPRAESVGWSVSSSVVFSARRLNAERFTPEYFAARRQFEATGRSVLLGDHVREPIRKGVAPSYDPDGEAVILNSQNIGRRWLDLSDAEPTSMRFWEKSKAAQVRLGDVVTYATGAYVGRTNVVTDDLTAVAGIDVLVARVAEPLDTRSLAVFLNSPAGLVQTRAFVSGSGQAHLYPDDLSQFVVVVPAADTRIQVEELLDDASRGRSEAEEYLAAAQRRVEDEVDRFVAAESLTGTTTAG
jgi:hypothetical protein